GLQKKGDLTASHSFLPKGTLFVLFGGPKVQKGTAFLKQSSKHIFPMHTLFALSRGWVDLAMGCKSCGVVGIRVVGGTEPPGELGLRLGLHGRVGDVACCPVSDHVPLWPAGC
ncbi:hypothetical protein GOODEAATRI_032589, partial [Goodea atripinnis]